MLYTILENKRKELNAFVYWDVTNYRTLKKVLCNVVSVYLYITERSIYVRHKNICQLQQINKCHFNLF